MSDCDRSPRFPAAGGLGADGSALATPRTVLQQLKAAAGDAERILSLVKEAERGHEDLRSLAEVYGVAVDFYGQPQSAQDYEYRDLCVKRMRALCRTSPAEAREFHNRLRTYTVGRADARMYEARAAMEERLGDTAKAVKMLQEGLKVGAQPAEVLQRVLGRLQPQAPAQPSAPSLPATPRGQAAPAPAASPRSAGAAAVPATPRAAGPLGGLTAALGRPRRILGLGSPSRNAPSDAEPADDEGTAGSAGSDAAGEPAAAAAPVAAGAVSGAGSRGRAVSESYTAASMSIMRLSPIREAESLDDASASHGSEARRSRGEPRCGEARRGSGGSFSGEAWGSEAGGTTPRAEAAGSTPAASRLPAAASTASTSAAEAAPGAAPAAPSSPKTSTSGQESPRKAQKVVYVNGVAYSQVRTLGRGGSSKVYLVEGPGGEVLALKRVVAENAKQLEAFQNEVILLQQLRDQEHVIQVVDAEIDREKGRINIVMEAGDMDLGSFLRSEPGLGVPQIQDLWRQMLEAVQVIHNERIVHSDLKPGNFLLVGGRLKVIDFGIAKRISNDTTNIHRDASVGTLSYMAPETIKQGHLKIGRASDIWSLGIILYQMVYGQPPFAALEPWQRMLRLSDPGLAIQLPEGRRLETCSPATRGQLLEVLGRCLQRDPRRRPSLEELLGHPFLQTRLEVRREALEGAVGALMAGVLRTVAAALQPQAPPPQLEDFAWRGLADELWERLANGEGVEGEGSTAGFGGLAPLEEQLRRLLAESRQQRQGPAPQQEGGQTRQPLRALTASTSAANVALGAAENAVSQQTQKQPQKRPAAPFGAGRMENGKENAGAARPENRKENADAGWSCSQQKEMAVRPGQVAEVKERLMRRLRAGP